MARRPVPLFPAMVVAIPLVIGIAAISTTHQAEMAAQRARAAAAPEAVPSDCILDGREQSFVVVGTSTSYVWPRMLQDMLDDHAGERLYHVHNAAAGSSPVKAWIGDEGDATYELTFGAMVRDYFGDEARLRGGSPTPSIAICQQTLQETLRPKGPVSSMADKEGIRIGADALERLATMLRDRGVDRVYMAMNIYKPGSEPEVGNERLALEALLTRQHDFVYEGPDVWSLTIAEFPACYTEDQLHPNERGMKIMAEAWYRTLAGSQASQAVIDRMHAREYDVKALISGHLRSRVPG